MSCGESRGEDKSVKFCDFRITERNCLCDSSGWTRLDDVTTHDNFLSFVHSLIRITAKIVLAPFFRSKNYHPSASFTLIQAPLCACKKNGIFVDHTRLSYKHQNYNIHEILCLQLQGLTFDNNIVQ